MMGRVTVDFTLANYLDVMLAETGQLSPDRIRRVSMRGVVDTGATRLVLPEAVARRLGLPSAGEASVRYANQQRAIFPVVRNAWVEMLGRSGDFNAILEQGRDEALIGAIVLEDLDLLVDCTTQKLVPRDPDRIVSEI